MNPNPFDISGRRHCNAKLAYAMLVRRTKISSDVDAKTINTSNANPLHSPRWPVPVSKTKALPRAQTAHTPHTPFPVPHPFPNPELNFTQSQTPWRAILTRKITSKTGLLQNRCNCRHEITRLPSAASGRFLAPDDVTSIQSQRLQKQNNKNRISIMIKKNS